MPDPYLYEFLYRGQPAGAAQPAAWHVQIAQAVALPGQPEQIAISGALTPDQAEAAGFSLSRVLVDINADALKQVAALTARAETAEASVAETKAAFDTQAQDLTAAQANVANLRQAFEEQAKSLTDARGDRDTVLAALRDAQAALRALAPASEPEAPGTARV